MTLLSYSESHIDDCLTCKHHKVIVNSDLDEIKELCEIHHKFKRYCNDYDKKEVE